MDALISPDTRSWEVDTVNAFFQPKNAAKILKIHVANSECDDLLSGHLQRVVHIQLSRLTIRLGRSPFFLQGAGPVQVQYLIIIAQQSSGKNCGRSRHQVR